ncbi:MAG: iron ABC transporter permease [Bacteroidetes bacterium]|nr:iron ABC transporter permease [Bacteroidota bacterium]MCY4233375.1 iron ABC transporter permease [Bacteroidota bacterium]
MIRWIILLGILGLLSLVISVSIGREVSFTDALSVLWYHTTFSYGSPPDPISDRIVWSLRLPRALLAIIVGGGLGIIGVAMQTLVRNPLAEPYILGISSGATAGASLFYLGFLPPLISKGLSMPIASFIGGLCAIAIVYSVAGSRGRISVTRLLLAGVAVASLMGALTSFITLSSPEPDKLRSVLFWLLGSFHLAQWSSLMWPAIAVTIGLIILMILSRPLDGMLTGDESAHSLGVAVESVKRILIVLASFVTGSIVAASGAIGFVGLIVPHAVRSFTGVTHRKVLPASFIGGAIFLLWADMLARSILPDAQLPVGIVTALCGVPFFLILLHRKQHSFG